MEEAKYQLEIIDKDDGVTYGFLITLEEIMSLSNMPFKLINSGNPGTESHLRLDGAGFDAYRLGEKLWFLYDNNQTGSIYPETKYSVVETILKDVADKIINNKNITTIKI